MPLREPTSSMQCFVVACHGAIVWGLLSEEWPEQILRHDDNSVFKLAAFEFLCQSFPRIRVYCPTQAYYRLPGARLLAPLTSDGNVSYEPMASSQNVLQRLC